MARNTRTYLPIKGKGPNDNGDQPASPTNVVPLAPPSAIALRPRRLLKTEFGKRLYSLIMNKGWNQSDLARAAGIGRASISSYVNGKDFPDPRSLVKLARGLGMEPEDLLPNTLESAAKSLDNPRLQITETETPNVVWLDVHQRTTSRKAREVMAILDDTPDAAD